MRVHPGLQLGLLGLAVVVVLQLVRRDECDDSVQGRTILHIGNFPAFHQPHQHHIDELLIDRLEHYIFIHPILDYLCVFHFGTIQ